MLRLRTLGGLSIENAAAISVTAAHRRPLALLALLAVEGRRGLSRDSIVAFLWPESKSEHGRNSLSQVISLLRRELPDGDVVLGSTELRLNDDVLACDVIEFEQRIAAGDLEAAIALYTGSFLEGVFLKNAPEFERWVDRERSRLEHVHGHALERLATRATAAGDHVSAVRVWRQRASLAPNDSRAALKLMKSLVASGDPAGALEHYRAHHAQLRDDLGLEPDATHAEFEAALRGANGLPVNGPTDGSSRSAASADPSHVTNAGALGEGSFRDEPAKISGLNVLATRRARWIVAAVLVLGLVAVDLVRRVVRNGGQTARLSQLSSLLPDGKELHRAGAALSPNGTNIVYAATDGAVDSRQRLFVQRLGQLHAQPLPKTDGATHPFFSPDGGSIGFTVGGKLEVMSLRDSSVTVVVDTLRLGFDEGADATWGDDGYILFGENSDAPTLGIRRVSAQGGPVQVLSRPDHAKRELAHFAPQRLPGTPTLIYTVRSVGTRGLSYRVVAQQLGSAASRLVIEGASRARYIDGGWLAYQIGSDVFVSRFDVRTLALSGRKPVASGVFPRARAQAWDAVADVFIYRPEVASMRTLVWVSRDGTRQPLSVPPDYYLSPALSPSNDRVAFHVSDATNVWDISIFDLRREVLMKVSSDGISRSPIWSSDGKQLTYLRRNGTGNVLYTRSADGTGSPALLFENGAQLWAAGWTRDMRTLVVMQHDTVTNGGDLWTLDRASRMLHPLVRSPAQEWGGRLSPDGRWLAYFSDVSGRFELYVTSFPSAGERWQVSQEGAREAVWSRDGRELYFRRGRQMLAVTLRPGARFDWDPPRVLFEGDYYQSNPGGANYDVSADGKRFLMIREPARVVPRLIVIQGWQRLGID